MDLGFWINQMSGSDMADNREHVLAEIRQIVERRERELCEELYKYGPDYLKNTIESRGGDFRKVYDILIFKQHIIKKIVLAHLNFFIDLVGESGPNIMRKIFQIEDSKYDAVFEQLFDIVAVSGGGIYAYLVVAEDELAQKVKERGAISIRQELGMVAAKYDEIWLEILDRLVGKFCDDYGDERVIENGLRHFTMMVNGARQHRSLRSFGKMWEFSEVGE